MKVNINMPEGVHVILNALRTAGHEAYIVGGCVRDSLMRKQPKDWDITTSARPEEVKRLFSHTYDTGIKHGTITVRIGSEAYEVTTYRIDGDYSDHRRPDEVTFASNLKEDLKRRDFTINAMAYHPKEGLVDLFSGREDLERGIIRCVGSPAERFDEDALRMLRALRFSAQTGFTIEENTKEAIRRMNHLLSSVSWERIRDEMNKILVSDHPETIREVYETGVLHYVIPEWEACMTTDQHNHFHMYTVGEHIIETMRQIDPEPVLRWTMFLHDIGKPLTRTVDREGLDHFVGHVEKSEAMAEPILRRLKFDNQSISRILKLIHYHEYRPEPEKKVIRRLVSKTGTACFEDLLKVWRADNLAKTALVSKEALLVIDRIGILFRTIMLEKQPLTLADLAVNGQDLMELGYPRGRIIGEVLKLLLSEVLEDPSVNQREILLQIAEQLKDRPELKKLM